jgi:hypothetical protein
MKKYLLIWTIFTTIQWPLQAQIPSGEADAAIADIQKLTSDWNRAIIQRDSLSLERILATDYTLNGALMRSVWMENTMHKIVTDTLNILKPLQITVYDNAAKSEGTIFWKGTFNGAPIINGAFSICDIWIKRDGRWQVLLRMSEPEKL